MFKKKSIEIYLSHEYKELTVKSLSNLFAQRTVRKRTITYKPQKAEKGPNIYI